MYLNESVFERTIKKYLRAKGYTRQEVEDYLLQFAYMPKFKISQLRSECSETIYNNDNTIKKSIECLPFFVDYNTTDMIIAELKNRPALLKALKNNHIIIVDSDRADRAGPRLWDLLEEIAPKIRDMAEFS